MVPLYGKVSYNKVVLAGFLMSICCLQVEVRELGAQEN